MLLRTNVIAILALLGLTGCGSLQLGMFAHKVPYIGVKKGLHEAKSVGEVKGEGCRPVWFTYIKTGYPTLDGAMKDLKEQGIKYVKNASIQYTASGTVYLGVFGHECLRIEGEGFR